MATGVFDCAAQRQARCLPLENFHHASPLQAAPKGLGAPAQRRYHRKSIFDFPIDKPFVWVVSLAIHAGREVGSDVHRRLPRALGPVHGRWLVDVVQSDGQQPAERDGWVRHAMGGAGDVAEEPHAIVELSGLTHRPKQTVDRIDAADLCNQAVDASCDPGTSVIVKVRAESANRDGITALAEAAAGGADVELPVHSAPPQAILAEVGVAPGQIERHALVQSHRDPGRQHPREAGPARARHDGRRPRKGHTGFADPGAGCAHAGPDERRERAEPRQAQPGQVDIGRQHCGQ